MASEVMKRKTVRAMTNAENTLLTVASGHTYTILNLSLCETAAAAETFDLYVDPLGGSNDTYIYKAQALGANATFEHTTRLTLEATDVLYAIAGSSADIDVVITYLDQTL
jgi:isopentenyl diphosphate isomerase/L-lactate dehydrogenase-like FMN-dependent dehydrogenase